MANKIVLKKSAVVGKIPQTSDLDYGELALNYAEGKLYYKNSSDVISELTSSGTESGVTLDTAQTITGNKNFTGITTLNEQRFVNSNTQKFSQIYTGSGYFTAGEFQELCTLTPGDSSWNYQVIGRILVQSGQNSQIIYFQAALRSNTLPDLGWTTSYSEELNGGIRYVNPVLWVKETSPAAFKIALEGLSQITGTVTVDLDVINRANNYFGTVVMNTQKVSDTTTIPAGFTQYAFNKTYAIDSGFKINGTLYATAKSFLIDHPTKPGMKLQYGSLEGPENGVYVRGRLTGTVIELPDYWTKLVDPKSITVQLTPIGRSQKLFVKEITNNSIVISSGSIWSNTIDCYYTVNAERIDVDKLEVERVL
jgi:hypothetical protein